MSENLNADLTRVKKAVIYPPIGIMRIGNSEESFVGPLKSKPEVKVPSFYRDATGKIKRQAAEFRIYGLDENDNVVCELTNDTSEEVVIDWHVQLANQKSEWYGFTIALDIPEAKDYPASFKRNLDYNDRMNLIIDSGKHTLSNNDDKCKKINLKGTIGNKSTEVYLGTLQYAEGSNRLHVLGGKGVADNIIKPEDGKTTPANTFANNENWYDDTSDGPVTATLKINQQEIDVIPAWVVCAPPDYAPLQKSVRTMWDLMRDLQTSQYDEKIKSLTKNISNITIELNSVEGMIQELKNEEESYFLQPKLDLLTKQLGIFEQQLEETKQKRNKLTPELPSIEEDILPIFQRMTDLQWVNKGFDETFGYNQAYDFRNKENITKLKDVSKINFAYRQNLYNEFRKVDLPGNQSPTLWPWVYGDAMKRYGSGTINQHTTLTNVQLDYLRKWVNGNIRNENNTTPVLEKEVYELTKGALDFCLADAFHPGCEMTWPVRQMSMYMEEFRFAHAVDMDISKHINYGESIDYTIVENTDLDIFKGQVAGGITRWMAIPWQTDTSSCRDGYNNKYSNYIPTFWPARVPNEILSYEQYLILKDLKGGNAKQIFSIRKEWLEDLPGHPNKLSPYIDVINSMIHHFDRVGIVLKQNIAIEGIPNEVQVAFLKDIDHLVQAIKAFFNYKGWDLSMSDQQLKEVILIVVNEKDFNTIGDIIDVLESLMHNKQQKNKFKLFTPIGLLNDLNVNRFDNELRLNSSQDNLKEIIQFISGSLEKDTKASLVKPGEKYMTIAEKFRDIYN